MPTFAPGAQKTAKAPVTVMPSGLSCQTELYLVSGSTKVATSGLISFTSTGAAQNITFPITMPSTTGTYKVYLDVFVSGMLIAGFVATEDVVIAVAGPVYLIPNGAGDATGLEKYPDADNWKRVDDPVGAPDDDATYVRKANGTGTTDYYSLSAPPVGITGINSLTVHFRLKNNGAPTYGISPNYPILRLGGIDTIGTDVAPLVYGVPVIPATWTDYSQTLARPGGGSWTETDLINLQVGIYLSQNGFVAYGFCTQIYVEVNYTPA